MSSGLVFITPKCVSASLANVQVVQFLQHQNVQVLCASLINVRVVRRDVHTRIPNPSKPVPNYGIEIIEVCLDALLQRGLCMNVSTHAFFMQ